MEPLLPKRVWVGMALLAGAILGWYFLGGWLFTLMALAGAGTLWFSYLRGDSNDMLGTRSEHPEADDTVRADDDRSQQPHPGPYIDQW